MYAEALLHAEPEVILKAFGDKNSNRPAWASAINDRSPSRPIIEATKRLAIKAEPRSSFDFPNAAAIAFTEGIQVPAH